MKTRATLRAIVLISVLLTAGPLAAESPFDNWQVFPGPNPEAARAFQFFNLGKIELLALST